MKYTKYAVITAAAGLALAGVCAVAQAPAATPTATAAVVPLADQPTDEQMARLFEVMHVKDQLASVSMPQMMQQQFSAQMQQMQKEHPEMAALPPEKQRAVSEVVTRYMQRAISVATGDDMLSEMAAIYKRHLTGADVEGAIAFYSSPAGEHFLNLVPVMMQELMPTVMHRSQEKMKPIMDEMQKELIQITGPAGSDSAEPAQK